MELYMADDWYYTQSHERQGPVSLAKLQVMANEGWPTRNDLVWQQGMPNWFPAETVRGLFGSGLLQTLKGAVEGIAKYPTEADSKLKGMPTDTKQARTVVSTHTATHANNNGPTLDREQPHAAAHAGRLRRFHHQLSLCVEAPACRGHAVRLIDVLFVRAC